MKTPDKYERTRRRYRRSGERKHVTWDISAEAYELISETAKRSRIAQRIIIDDLILDHLSPEEVE